MFNSIRLLNGEQLVDCGSKNQVLPLKGPKCSLSSGSWLEQKQIESAIDERKNALQYQRIEKVGSLTQAVWLEEISKALVIEKKGAYWLHIGHSEDQKTYIYPEEIIHLLEMNALDLKYGGVRMSLQQAYSKFIDVHISMDEYKVYSNLSRQGYKLVRHNPSTVYNYVDSSDEEITVININPKDQMETNNAKVAVTNDYICVNDSSGDDCTMMDDTATQSEKPKNDVMLIDSDESSGETDVVCLPSYSLKCKILSCMPNCYNKRFIVLNNPGDKYMPSGIRLTKKCYGLSMESLNNDNKNREQLNNFTNDRPYRIFDHLTVSRFNNNNFFNSIMQNYFGQRYNNFRRFPINNIFQPNYNTHFQRPNFFVQRKPSISRNEMQGSSSNTSSREISMSTSKTMKNIPTVVKKESDLKSTQVKSRKEQIFNEIKEIISQYTYIELGNKSSAIKEALILAIIKYNDMFGERYTLVFKHNKCLLEEMSKDDEEKPNRPVLLLSSDSDSPPSKLIKKSYDNEKCVRERKKRCKRKVILSDFNVLSVNITSSSDEDENIPCRTQPSRNFLDKSLEKSVSQNTIHKWFIKDSWSKPELGNSKRKDYIAGVGPKIAAAILESIRDLSYKKDCPIESWSQGKQLYKDKITSNAICISDEETSEDGNEIKSVSSNITISPLIGKEDCISVECIMKKLSIVNYFDYQNNSGAGSNKKFKISYDMYMPTDKTLRKSDLPPPAYHVIVVSDKSSLPMSSDLSDISKDVQRNVPVLFAVVSFDTMSYVLMENISLPSLLRKN